MKVFIICAVVCFAFMGAIKLLSIAAYGHLRVPPKWAFVLDVGFCIGVVVWGAVLLSRN